MFNGGWLDSQLLRRDLPLSKVVLNSVRHLNGTQEAIMIMKRIALAVGLSACLIGILSLLGVFAGDKANALITFVGVAVTCFSYGYVDLTRQPRSDGAVVNENPGR